MTMEDCRAVLSRIRDQKPKKFFLDSDTANEIDDQFAVAYALLADNVDVIGNYLTGLMRRDHNVPRGTVKSETHIIWDIASVAVLRDIWGFWEPEIRDALSVDEEGMFRPSPAGGKMIYNKRYRRDGIFTDLFTLIGEKAGRGAGERPLTTVCQRIASCSGEGYCGGNDAPDAAEARTGGQHVNSFSLYCTPSPDDRAGGGARR